MKAIRLRDEELHRNFKAACAQHGTTMIEAAQAALRALLAWWAEDDPAMVEWHLSQVDGGGDSQ